MAVGVTLAVVASFLLNVFKLQDRSCALRVGQPLLGDVCAAIGFGSAPSRRERSGLGRDISCAASASDGMARPENFRRAIEPFRDPPRRKKGDVNLEEYRR
jgi:hypothetical protein